jgi:ketosteroid isomerase-like protein
MSQENVETVRRYFEALGRGDYNDALALVAPDVVWKVAQEAPVQGPDAIRSVWDRWEADWEELEETPGEFIDAGDHVFVTVHYQGRGRGSGILIDARVYHVYTLRDGKCVRKVEFTDRAEALEAAGLSEQDISP